MRFGNFQSNPIFIVLVGVQPCLKEGFARGLISLCWANNNKEMECLL